MRLGAAARRPAPRAARIRGEGASCFEFELPRSLLARSLGEAALRALRLAARLGGRRRHIRFLAEGLRETLSHLLIEYLMSSRIMHEIQT
eukprot:6173315-Pleurochrysis_carterae.AAC.2